MCMYLSRGFHSSRILYCNCTVYSYIRLNNLHKLILLRKDMNNYFDLKHNYNKRKSFFHIELHHNQQHMWHHLQFVCNDQLYLIKKSISELCIRNNIERNLNELLVLIGISIMWHNKLRLVRKNQKSQKDRRL